MKHSAELKLTYSLALRPGHDAPDYSTIEFYRRFQAGELGDDDDLLLWAGLYRLYLTSLPVRQFMQSESVPA